MPETDPEESDDVEEAVVEEEISSEPVEPKTETVMVGLWEHMNSQPPLWMRYVPSGLIEWNYQVHGNQGSQRCYGRRV